MADWLAANWFGVVTFVAGSILTVVVSFIFKNRKVLKVKIEHSEVITKSDDNLPGIEIRYYDKPVDRLSKTTFTIWNGGNSIITKDDIVEIDPLRCEVDKEAICLIDKGSVALGRKACNVKIDYGSVPIKIVFDFLDKRDGFTYAIIHSSEKKPKVAGVIRGTRISVNSTGRSIRDIVIQLIGLLIFVFFIAPMTQKAFEGDIIQILLLCGIIAVLFVLEMVLSFFIRKTDIKTNIDKSTISN